VNLVAPNSTSLNQGKNLTSTTISQFVEKHRNNLFAYALTPEELATVFSNNETGKIFSEQITKIQNLTNLPMGSTARLKALEERQRITTEARTLVDNLFQQQSIEQMNLDLLSVFNQYLTDPSARGPLQYIIQEIENYNFSPQQLHDIHMRATTLHQATMGTWIATGVFAAIALKKSLPSMIKGLEKNWSLLGRFGKNTAETIAARSTTTPLTEVERILMELERAGNTSAKSIQARANNLETKFGITAANESKNGIPDALITNARSTPGKSRFDFLKAGSVLHQNRVFRWAANALKSQSFKNFALFTGANIAASGVYVGFNGLNKAYFDTDIDDHYLNTVELDTETSSRGRNLKSDYYDGLAVLNLTCSSYDFMVKTKSRLDALKLNKATALSSEQILEQAQELNEIYTEYFMLAKTAPRYFETIRLPEEIKMDESTGLVSLDITLQNRLVHEEVSCSIFATSQNSDKRSSNHLKSTTSAVDVNLGYPLNNLREALTNIFEAEELVKKNSQSK
jgi:hypothetical protein